MKSLFLKILLWFIVAALTTAGAVGIANQFGDSPSLIEQIVGSFLDAHLAEAVALYESGGAPALQRYRERFAQAFGGPIYITDAQGRDLATGEDRSGLIRAAAHFGGRMVFVFRSAVLGRTSQNGSYRIFVPVARGAFRRAFVRPRLGLVLLAVLGLCALLAGHLTRPVRELQRAVDRFGKGDTEARIHSTRKDEIGQLARSFDNMAGRISELMQGQRRLLLDISHELRSPLARLNIATDLLRSDPSDEAMLRQIETESERLNELVGEILKAHRPLSQEERERFAPVQLELLLVEVAASCRLEAEAQARRLELQMDSKEVVVSGVRELLRRAVENVIRNAIRHAPSETSVRVQLARLGDRAVITVRDYGAGVPESALGYLFQPFYRAEADRSRASGGVGLGLTIARRAVELHQGTIHARNANPGLEVCIDFPAAERNAA